MHSVLRYHIKWMLVIFTTGLSISKGSYFDEEARLRREYPENELLLQNLQNQSYKIIYPIQMRQHLKLGVSTKYTTSDASDKHYQQTTLLITAFAYDLRLELELNKYLLSPNLIRKNLLADGVVISSQAVENCYYHALIKDIPKASAALRTCNGISGIIYLPNDTFAIKPFYGGDQSRKHPHVIYRLQDQHDVEEALPCDITKVEEVEPVEADFGDNLTDITRARRDIQEVVKYVELGVILDNSMFTKENGIRSAVLGDVIQSVNYADLYYKKINTRLSIVYLETWDEEDQFETDDSLEQLSASLINYVTEKLTTVTRDVVFFMTTRDNEAHEGKLGTCVPSSVCTDRAVVVLKGTPETYIVAGIMSHMLGHSLGLNHDSAECECEDWLRGCVMEEELTPVPKSDFSSCSLEVYLNVLQNNKAVCIFNKPYPLENIPSCGNGIIEADEVCDCGSMQDCMKNEPCCDSITCRLKPGAECSMGVCCERCKLKPKGHLCRASVSECDIAEYCDGINGECPTDIYRKNGNLCGDGNSYCYMGTCPSPKLLCEHIWGRGSCPAEQVCFDRLNVHGGLGGHCGRDGHGGYRKCEPENVRCGALHCQGGVYTSPLMALDSEYTSAVFMVNGTEYFCKLMQGNESTDVWTVIPEGSKCAENKICVNKSCVDVAIVQDACPTNSETKTCSGHGICSTIDTCYCDKGWTYFDCSMPGNITDFPDDSTPQNTKFWKDWLKSVEVTVKKDEQKTRYLVLSLTGAVALAMTLFALLASCPRCSKSKKRTTEETEDEESLESRSKVQITPPPDVFQ